VVKGWVEICSYPQGITVWEKPNCTARYGFAHSFGACGYLSAHPMGDCVNKLNLGGFATLYLL
jgi:hypothetical protein